MSAGPDAGMRSPLSRMRRLAVSATRASLRAKLANGSLRLRRKTGGDEATVSDSVTRTYQVGWVGGLKKRRGSDVRSPKWWKDCIWLGRLLKELFHFAPGVKLDLGQDRRHGDDGSYLPQV